MKFVFSDGDELMGRSPRLQFNQNK